MVRAVHEQQGDRGHHPPAARGRARRGAGWAGHLPRRDRPARAGAAVARHAGRASAAPELGPTGRPGRGPRLGGNLRAGGQGPAADRPGRAGPKPGTCRASGVSRCRARRSGSKVVPPFFAHESDMLARLAGGPVPTLLGSDRARILMPEIPGEDLDHATLPQLIEMVTLLVGLQQAWIGRFAELMAIGLPDWRAQALGARIADVVDRTAAELTAEERGTLAGFVDELSARFERVGACGLPDTLVHGDFFPGNTRGIGTSITLLDWGDCGVGHPLLDQAAFLDRVPSEAVPAVRDHWHRLWARALPGSQPQTAADLPGSDRRGTPGGHLPHVPRQHRALGTRLPCGGSGRLAASALPCWLRAAPRPESTRSDRAGGAWLLKLRDEAVLACTPIAVEA